MSDVIVANATLLRSIHDEANFLDAPRRCVPFESKICDLDVPVFRLQADESEEQSVEESHEYLRYDTSEGRPWTSWS
jgi:hypothetical protein